VTITRARWRNFTLTVDATTSNPNAVLTGYTPSGAHMFDLGDRGNGNHSFSQSWRTNVVGLVVTVRSNLGGSATAVITS
jgi:hypothetical protein